MTTHDSYPEVMDEYLAHWALVDGALGSGQELTVQAAGMPGPVGRGEFLSLAGTLRAKAGEVDRKELEGRVAAGELELRRRELLEGLRVFSDTVRAWWAGRPEAKVVRPMPDTGAALDKVLGAVRWAGLLWERVDAGTGGVPPGVVLPLVAGPVPGLTRAGLAGRASAVVAARDAVEAADFAGAVLRSERDALEGAVRGVMSAYGRAVPVRLGSVHALAGSVPRMTPLPGSTPGAVSLTGTWDAAAGAARLEWSASDAGEALDFYQIRWCPGEDYNKKEERVALRVPADGDRVALVTRGMETDGSVAGYKVYVVTRTGNERGSGAVVVRRGTV